MRYNACFCVICASQPNMRNHATTTCNVVTVVVPQYNAQIEKRRTIIDS